MIRYIALVFCLVSCTLNASESTPWMHAFSLYGEPKYEKDFAHFDYIKKDAPKKGAIRLRVIGTFDSLNPYILKGIPAEGHFLTTESLLKRSADEPFTMYARIAEAIQLPKDRSWIRFRLRPEARFHDGSPILAEDVAFSYQTLKTKGMPNLQYFYSQIGKVEILGERDIKFTFSSKNNRQLSLLLGFMPILSKAYYTKHDFDRTTLEAPLSSGPYKIDYVKPGKRIIYKRVPDYWGEKINVNVGQYNFDEIQYLYMRDDTVSLQSFKKKEYDFREETNIGKWTSEYNFDAVNDKRVKLEVFPVHQSMGMQGLVFNLRNSHFKDRRVRKALSLALDFEWLNRNYLHASYKRTESFFTDPRLSACGKPEGQELDILKPHKALLTDDIFNHPIEKILAVDRKSMRDELQQARELLKQAGWTIKSNRLVDNSGKPMKFEILLVQPFHEKIVQTYARNLSKLGIQTTIRRVDPTQYEKRTQDHDFGMIIHYWNQSYYPGDEQTFYWGSSQSMIKGSKNLAGTADPVIDHVIHLLPRAQKLDTYLATTKALDRLLRAGHYVIPLFHPKEHHCALWDKFGYPTPAPPHGFRQVRWWALHTWWDKG